MAFFDTLAALLASLVIIPAMATTGAKLDQGGPGLLFIFLPNLIKNMPGGKIIVIIFFVAVLFAGLTSLINLYEAPIATVQEKFHLERKPACAVIAVIGVIVSILIQGIVSGWMDVLSIYICPLGAGLAGIMLFWVCGKEYVEKQVNKGRSSHLTSWSVSYTHLRDNRSIRCPRRKQGSGRDSVWRASAGYPEASDRLPPVYRIRVQSHGRAG